MAAGRDVPVPAALRLAKILLSTINRCILPHKEWVDCPCRTLQPASPGVSCHLTRRMRLHDTADDVSIMQGYYRNHPG